MSRLALAPLFGNGMVLQREQPIVIAGRAPAASRLEVRLASNHAETNADAGGRWEVTLPALAAGGPWVLEARCGTENVLCDDILIGDVWLCAGQSNMERPLRLSHEAESEIPRACYPQMRLAMVPRTLTAEPLEETPLRWSECTPQAAAQFSGAGYYFGREIHRATDVPIGLLDCSVGGTPIEAWLPLTDLEPCAAGPAALAARTMAEKEESRHLAEYEKALPLWERKMAECYARPSPGALSAEARVVEGPWSRIVSPYFNGAVIYERKFVVPESWSGETILYHLDPLLASDVCFLNGVRVGASLFADPAMDRTSRSYLLPGELVRAGENTLSLRLIIRKDMRVLARRSGAVWLESMAEFPRPRLELEGGWRAAVESDAGQRPQAGGALGNRAAYIYNGMLHPLRRLAICGTIWYQGEANVSRAQEYAELLRVFIRMLRRHWRQGDFPFYVVQLANLFEPPDSPKANKWAALREAQLAALEEPNTGIAPAHDIGETEDIHPANKKDVGLRLARLALRRHYAEGLRATNPAAIPASDSGPVFVRAARDGDSLRLEFQTENRALAARGGEVLGFHFEAADGALRSAAAKLEVGSVMVPLDGHCADFLSYAWVDDPAGTLYNEDGLPARPFRLGLRPLLERI